MCGDCLASFCYLYQWINVKVCSEKDAPVWVVCIDRYTVKSKDHGLVQIKEMKQKFEKVSNDEEELVEFENTFGCEVREFQVWEKNEALILL